VVAAVSAGDVTQGCRVLPDDGDQFGHLRPGDYFKHPTMPGVWIIRDPAGKLGSLQTHTVVEHEDGTITVSPSILDSAPGGWHGYLERGVWREV
jgi:hypothetical protein